MDLVKLLSAAKTGIQGAAWWVRFQTWRKERDEKKRREEAERAAKAFVLVAALLTVVASCRTLGDLAQYCQERPWECGQGTPPPPRSTPTPAPSATVPAATPTTAPTATSAPTLSGWVTTQKFINGFAGCNPRQSQAEALANPRTACSGDRTALFNMPDHDIIPQGTGCQTLNICLDGPLNERAACINNCMVHDSPGTPCGGAAACEFPARASCPRSVMGCNSMEWDTETPARGSKLTATGVDCTDQGGFAFVCHGTPGAAYELCTEPWPNARTVDGRPVIGGSRMCKSGWF